MSTGSKVVLLLTFIFIAFLIWHYGPAPAATQADIEPAALAIDEPDSTPAPAEPIRARPSTAIATATAPVTALPPRPAPQTAPLGTTTRLRAPAVETVPTVYMGQSLPPVAANPAQVVATNFRPVPSPVTTTVQRPKPAAARSHVVVNGDTLSGISLRYYGNEYSWNIIASANPGVDPDRLRIGHRLTIPERARKTSSSSAATVAKAPVIQPGHKQHRVQDGESLSTISSQHYGRETWWIHIFEANKVALKNDPDRLKIGMVLSIPGRQLITD